MSKARTIALYLPQFHPIPENDEWWGRGFTEWTNVAKARPLFRGHYQPHLPADLGFCDLRVAEVRSAQADLARDHGIDGFSYYHYWFNGRRLLNRPFDEVLASGAPNFPFCLCWANEPWSRRWTGEDREILMAQEHSAADDDAHGRFLARAFADPRYIRHHGRPLFLVWRPRHLPDPPKATLDRIAAAVQREGLPRPFFMGVDSHCPGTDCRDLGFDATMTFAPNLGYLPGGLTDGFTFARLRRNVRRGRFDGWAKAFSYEEAVESLSGLRSGKRAAPCAFVGWDNSPRRGRNGVVITGGGPEAFGTDFRRCLDLAHQWDPQEPLVFINAWNEWAEGCHLEPDQRWGRAFLEKVRERVGETSVSSLSDPM
jgi:lipopolysaccharide biosynthesis protein